MDYQPEPELTAEEREAIESIKRRAQRRAAAKELAAQGLQPGAVLVLELDDDGNPVDHKVVRWG